MNSSMLESLQECPIVAAVKNLQGLERALQSECQVIFILYGDVCGVADITKRVKEAGKLALVHIDLIDGLANREAAVMFLKQYTVADGIISTKAVLIKTAKELGLLTVQRFFLLDSLAFENAMRNITQADADFIEILPGVMPKIIKRITQNAKVPIIAGGLITDKEDIVAALGAGATAVSTTNKDIWAL